MVTTQSLEFQPSRHPRSNMIAIWVLGNPFALTAGCPVTQSPFATFPVGFSRKSVGEPAGKVASCQGESPLPCTNAMLATRSPLPAGPGLATFCWLPR